MTKASGQEEEARMPLLAHLHELRTRLIRAGIAIAIGMVISLAFVDVFYSLLTAPLRLVIPDAGGGNVVIDEWYRSVIRPIADIVGETKVEGKLANLAPLDGIYTYFRVAMLGGIVLSLPVTTWQIWGFIAPGLYKTERRMVYPLVFFSTMLFLVGAGFAYFIILPLALPFFLTVIDAEAVLGVQSYLNTVIRMMTVFGGCFQLPVVVWFLSRLGLIDHRDLIDGFRYAIVGIFLVAAIVTPPEISTQIALAIPLTFLYGVGIVVSYFSSTKVRETDAT